uniref:Pecanex-like protein n=1 Tax=Brugia pahangi TaxID=6280 RepID=A0A0N4T320_BRUPA
MENYHSKTVTKVPTTKSKNIRKRKEKKNIPFPQQRKPKKKSKMTAQPSVVPNNKLRPMALKNLQYLFSKNESAKLKFSGDIEIVYLLTTVFIVVHLNNDGTINIESKYATNRRIIGVLSEMDLAIHRISYHSCRIIEQFKYNVIVFAFIYNYVDVFYGMNKQRIGFHWFFIICTIPIDLFSIWMSSSFGLRFDILIVAWTNSIGTTMRLISSFLPLQIRFPVGIFGQAVTACACIAGSCFPENQRALATTIGIMANILSS